jgi:sugar phosphate isomerase/epimerase
MEMLRDYVIVLAYAVALAAALGVGLVVLTWFAVRAMPGDEGNRPVSPEVLRAREEARLDALERIAARAARKGY